MRRIRRFLIAVLALVCLISVLLTPTVYASEQEQVVSWSLMNLIFTLAGVALAFMMFIKTLIMTDRETEDAKYYGASHSDNKKIIKSGSIALILAIPFLGIAGILLFVLTQDMKFPMVMFDRWTVSHAILFLCGLLSYILAYKKDETNKHLNP